MTRGGPTLSRRSFAVTLRADAGGGAIVGTDPDAEVVTVTGSRATLDRLAITFVTGQYRFDTWRLTYRYAFWISARLEATVGLTGLVRDAGISLHGGDVFQEKLNTGLVPLLSFSLLWRFAGPWSLLLDGDALAGGPGRAEDVTIALRRQLGDDLAVRVGYRLVEGGADVDEVYNFALVSYAAAALEVGF